VAERGLGIVFSGAYCMVKDRPLVGVQHNASGIQNARQVGDAKGRKPRFLQQVFPDIDHRFMYKPLKKKRYKFPFTVL
jgi:hypothetical protein